jgi:2-dehydropantoate 2-reductase
VSKIAIMGAGALGCYIGAFLIREGMDITFIDMWPDHVETMRRDGLRVSGSQGEFSVPAKALHLTDAQAIDDLFDIAFIAVKSYDTEWATHFIKRYVKPDGYFVSSQNSMNDQTIASIVGYQRELGCIASHIEVALWEPGHVTRGGAVGRDHGHFVFRVGEMNGHISPRAEEVAGWLDCIDAAKPTNNLWGERWAKLAQNSIGNAVSAMSGLGSQGMAESPVARYVRIHIGKETVQVGKALNYQIEEISGVDPDLWGAADEPDVFNQLDEMLKARGGRVDWRASMAQDVAKGRRSEVDYLNGLVAEKGREAGIPTPVNHATVEVMRDIDAGRVQPDPSLIDRLIQA